MEVQLRQPGTRTATSPKVSMDSRPMSTFTQLQPGSTEAEQQMRESAYSLRNSQDTSSAKDILKNVESAAVQGREVLKEYVEECAELSQHLRTMETQITVAIDAVPTDISTALQTLIDSMRSEFISQTQENNRLEKQLNQLKHDKTQLQQQADDQSKRIGGMEDAFHIPVFQSTEGAQEEEVV